MNENDFRFGTQVMVRTPHYGETFGLIIEPTKDRRNMQIYLPEEDVVVFVKRKCVLPLKQNSAFRKFNCGIPGAIVTPAAAALTRTETNSPEREEEEAGDPEVVKSIQNNNIGLTMSGDPNWVRQHRFDVPPPEYFPVGPPNVLTTSPDIPLLSPIPLDPGQGFFGDQPAATPVTPVNVLVMPGEPALQPPPQPHELNETLPLLSPFLPITPTTPIGPVAFIHSPGLDPTPVISSPGGPIPGYTPVSLGMFPFPPVSPIWPVQEQSQE